MASSSIYYRDATELAELIRTRKWTSVQVVGAHLDRIAALDKQINAIVSFNEKAMEEAEAADMAIMSGDKALGPLHGVPFTVKDSIDTAGVPTQRGSLLFRGRTPDSDATAVARMKAAGAIIIAKTNVPEFSYGTESDNFLSGRTSNPWNLEKTPGGSSGGESAAIAAGLSPIGLGTDLSISVRGPAAQTGIVSLKATHGRVPMTGVWPRNPRRFWHLGPMARSIRDLELAYDILAGPDGCDALSTIASAKGAVPHNKPLRVGWLVEPGFGPIDAEVRSVVQDAAEALSQAGCTVDSVRIPALERDFSLDLFLRLHINEMKWDAVQTVGNHPRDQITGLIRRMLDAPETSVRDHICDEQAADRLKDGFAEYFSGYDALLCPVLPITAHDHGLAEYTVNGRTVGIEHVMAATVPFSITGLPAVSMRFGTSHDRLPINVQVVGSWYAESTILHLAKLLESVSMVKDHRPIN